MKSIITASILAITFAAPAYAEGGGKISSASNSASTSQSAISTNQGGDEVNSATVVAPSSNNTAPCVMAPSIGIGGGGFGIGGSTPYVDRDCVTRIEAQILTQIADMRGDARRAAIYHFCSNTPTMRRTMIAINWCATK